MKEQNFFNKIKSNGKNWAHTHTHIPKKRAQRKIPNANAIIFSLFSFLFG